MRTRSQRRKKFVSCVRKLEAKGSPGYNPYAVCHSSTNYHGTSYNIGIRHEPFRKHDLLRGMLQEHNEHPSFTLRQARQIAKDHLLENPKYYVKRRKTPIIYDAYENKSYLPWDQGYTEKRRLLK